MPALAPEYTKHLASLAKLVSDVILDHSLDPAAKRARVNKALATLDAEEDTPAAESRRPPPARTAGELARLLEARPAPRTPKGGARTAAEFARRITAR